MSSPHKKPRTDRCFNPFNIEKGHSKNLRKVTKTIKDAYTNISDSSVICNACRKSFYYLHTSASADDTSIDSQADPVDSEPDRSSPSNFNTESETEIKDDLTDILDGLRNKFKSLPPNDPLRVSILTILPKHWTLQKIMDEFGSSYRMARKAKQLRDTNGVLSFPVAKHGKNLPLQTIENVINFYQNDVNSRMMPNKKDKVVVRFDGEKKEEQKRLLLNDIKNLHNQFKKEFPAHPIGLTKFAELRPKWCVLAGSAGTHNVCVCTIHQNFKAMIDAINLAKISNNNLKDDKDCLNYVLCKEPAPKCYLNGCKSCPQFDKFSAYVETLMEDHNIEQVIFSTWQSTDRCTLIKECLPSQEFIESLCSRLKKLLPHHFIAKEQSKFISEKKKNLTKHEVLVQLDFSENYAYVAQNAAQGFHYNNNQCTIFPAVVYYKSEDEIKHISTLSMSECITHDATAVYCMQKKLVDEIRKLKPRVKKIIYVSDGAKQHFKNRFQMCNLMYHKKDFDIDAEWHCSATAHGKSATDGIGALLKREATRASLQASENEAILDVESLFSWAKKKLPNISFFWYTADDHKTTGTFLAKRFKDCPPVTGIQTAHGFIPKKENILSVMEYSYAKKLKLELIYNINDNNLSTINAPKTRSKMA